MTDAPRRLPEVVRAARRSRGAVILVTHRGDWCPFCCGQLVAMAADEARLNQAGAEIIAIGADTRRRSEALAARWGLPFPVLADPGGDLALRRLDLWNAEEHGGIAAVASVVFGPDGSERWRELGRDVADRPDNDTLVAAASALGLPPLPPMKAVTVGAGEAGPEAFPTWAFDAYFNGVLVSSTAIRRRLGTEEDRSEAHRVARLASRYLQAWAAWRPTIGS